MGPPRWSPLWRPDLLSVWSCGRFVPATASHPGKRGTGGTYPRRIESESTVTTATKTRTRKPVTPAATPAAPTMAELEAALRTRWDEAGKGETGAKNLLDAAKISWENSRVVRCRVALEAAMLVPNAGKPNLLNATRILGTDTDATTAERTAEARKRKNSLRNYLNAGVALHEAGLAGRVTEPDQAERDIVRDVFRAGNKSKAAAAAGGETEGETEGGSTPAAPESQDPVTQADVVKAVEVLKSVTERFCRDHGFAAVVADNLQTVMAEIGALMETHKVDGGD